MGVMAADTSQGPAFPALFLGCRKRVPLNGMPSIDPGKPDMTTDAKLVDRFKKGKLIIGGVGIMTGYAALPDNNAMNILHPFLLLASHQVLLVTMAVDTELRRTFGPEQIPVFISMGGMTQGATSNHGSMRIFTGLPVLFTDVTGDTDTIDISNRKTNSPGFDGFLVTVKALLIDGQAVLPCIIVNKIAVTCGTGSLFYQANGIDV